MQGPHLGTDVTWCFVVTNEGDTTLVDVGVSDPALGVTEADLSGDTAALALLDPGASVVLYLEGTIDGTLPNVATVTGTPADPAGDPYPGLPDVSDDDDATVAEVAPSIAVAKTVYQGHDGGAQCPGGELVQGATGAEVTYCFVVTNDGDTTLADVTLADVTLGVDETDMDVVAGDLSSLAPGQSATLSFEGVLDGDLLNTVEVTGTPVDDQGDPIAGVDPVTDDDTAEVDDVSPSITIEKSVHAGHTGGDDCPGDPHVALRNGDDVTYCFVITNDGEATLDPVTFSDPALGLTEADVEVRSGSFADPLVPGGVIVAYHEATVADDLTNVATVTGTPVDDGGDPLPGADPVTDDDVATVDEVAPAVTVDKTVYQGWDDGAGCEGEELVHGLAGDAVTYCFVVTNTGDTPLDPIVVADGDLDVGTADLTVVGGGPVAPLAPQASVTLYVETTVDGDLVNTVDVSGTPVDGNGDPLPEVPDVVDDDTAEVVQVAPSVTVEKTVYQGHDGGAGCEGGESVPGLDGDPVTYCFVVTNTGDTTLASVRLDDGDLGISETDMTVLAGDLDSLGLVGSVTLYYEATIAGDLTNTVTATATPADGQGDPLPGLDDVTDDDTADVDEVAPSVSVVKTVARGHEGGANCNGTDLLHGLPGEEITWCFVVTNTGDTTLAPVTLDDAALAVDESDLTVVGGGSLASLAPDASVTLFLEGAVDGDLDNTATVEGTPADGQGDPLPGIDPVSDDDDAQVVEVDPSISVAKTVYRGHDDGAGCEGAELVAGENGDPVTWCFVITNEGDTPLAAVTFADPALSLADASALGGDVAALDAALAPGASVTLWYETTVDGDLVPNTATVSGSPADDAGDPLPGVDDVTDADDAAVDAVGPAVLVAKTVYAGHDGGAGCEGDELVAVRAGDDVTWCIVVTNTGDTALRDVSVVDDDLGVTEADLDGDTAALGLLGAGESAVLFLEGTATADLENTATASGTPADDQGDPLGLDDVSDDDTAAVDVVAPSLSVAKTVYRGHDDGAGCPGDDAVTGVAGRAVTWCFVVTNTGDTRLAPVTLEDADLGVDQVTMTVLSGDLSALDPGASAVLYVEGTVDGDLDNTVVATGTPVDDTDTPLPEVPDVTDDDTATVDEIHPSLTLLTEVHDPLSGDWYDADADGGTLGSNDGVPATLRAGDTASFRFTVTNTGDVGLTDPVVDAPQCDEPPTVVSGDSINSGVLDVGETWVLSCTVSDLSAGLTLDAAVTAGSPDGDPEGSGGHEAAEVQVAAISVDKQVLDPDTEDFADLATLEEGADATFRIVVTNTGEVALGAISVADALGPDCARDFTDVLEPGESFAAYTCTVRSVTDGFVNVATATGTPVDGGGDPIGADVADDDGATVAVEASPLTDLAITKDLIGIDNDLLIATWQVTVTNVGDTPATEPIFVTDELNDALQFRDAGGDGWTCEFDEPTLICATDTDLAPGGSTSFTVETYVIAEPGTSVTNVARVDGIEDTNSDNNIDDAVVDVESISDVVVIEPDTPGNLARTGADVLGLVVAGVLLVAAGLGLHRAGRRRTA
ncbi:MAG: hypothetical protein H6518_03230 [Microthrixaceae bacterium]|nr:hypothetical protein [Microthrixaceae bacterium]